MPASFRALSTRAVGLENDNNKSGYVKGLRIRLDDGTGTYEFEDFNRIFSIKKGDYIKIFCSIKPKRNGN